MVTAAVRNETVMVASLMAVPNGLWRRGPALPQDANGFGPWLNRARYNAELEDGLYLRRNDTLKVENPHPDASTFVYLNDDGRIVSAVQVWVRRDN